MIYLACALVALGIVWWIFLVLRDVAQKRGYFRDWPWKKSRQNR